MVAYDALFNGFHIDAMPILMPYMDGMERMSWWNQQLFMIQLTTTFYPKQVIQINAVGTTNPSHEDYPRDENFGKVTDVYREFLSQPFDQKSIVEPKSPEYSAMAPYVKPRSMKVLVSLGWIFLSDIVPCFFFLVHLSSVAFR